MNFKISSREVCKSCCLDFIVFDNDIKMLGKLSPKIWNTIFPLPKPKLCPSCREQRRLSFINYMNLFKSTCNWCWNNIVSRFNPESWIKVYCTNCWASDNHDYLKEGIDIDFSKSVFEQISYLVKKTPFQNLVWGFSNIKNNSIYTNHTADIHNSYMVSEADFVENCMYWRGLRKSNHLVDCLNCWNSEYCYECVDSSNLYNCFYLLNSTSCNNSYYLQNSHWCSNCVWCVNLTNKSHHIFNKEVSKKEYEIFVQDINTKDKIDLIKREYNKLIEDNKTDEKYILNSENCEWNYISNSKNCFASYDINSCEDLRFCTDINNSTDLMDISSYWSHSEHMYEWAGVWRYSRNIYFSNIIWKWEDLFYCIDVKKSKNCFASVNLKEMQYCILNKQYTKEEYFELLPKIIKHMQKIWEWWEFFPSNISPFWYNETVADEYYPLKETEAISNWFNWSSYESPTPKVDKVIQASKLGSTLKDIPDDILNWAIKCDKTNKPFRILREELDFYRKHNISIPKLHPDERHLNRVRLRNIKKD